MTERTANDAGAIACPFVAFVDDREERAAIPDHRHRCYAEIRPAQRAIAHQQAFCLSAGFAACPTFQDWARREAARARGGAPNGRPAEAVAAGAAAGSADEDDRSADAASGLDEPGPEDDLFDDRATRNPHRDWAAPPPWVEPGAPESLGPSEPEAPSFLAPRSSASDAAAVAPAGLSASRWLQEVPAPRLDEGTPGSGRADDDELERALAEDRANRERAAAAVGGVSATASSSRAARKAIPPATPQTVSSARRRPVTRDVAGPLWERPRRYEAYPTLKTRIGLPSIPRIALAALAIFVAAGVVFLVPFLLRNGDQGGGAVVTPSPSSAPSASVASSGPPAPTAQVYVVKSGDTLNKIAKKFGLTVDQLLAANKQIKNPNKIQPGDEITIPVAAPSEIVSGASTPPSAAP